MQLITLYSVNMYPITYCVHSTEACIKGYNVSLNTLQMHQLINLTETWNTMSYLFLNTHTSLNI